MGSLDSVLAAAAGSLPEGQLNQIARALETLNKPDTATRAILEASAVGSTARRHAEQIASAWAEHSQVPGFALALALRSAAVATNAERAAERVEIAWTGPATPAVALRRTESILLELIGHAQDELIVVSFAAYDVPEVVQALSSAAHRGVRIWLVLESSAESEGRLSFDARVAFNVLRGHVKFYSWPIEKRAATGGGHSGSLHAKAVVADGTRALVTSANLTGRALEANMELGLLVEGGSIPTRLALHFRELIDRGTLREVAES